MYFQINICWKFHETSPQTTFRRSNYYAEPFGFNSINPVPNNNNNVFAERSFRSVCDGRRTRRRCPEVYTPGGGNRNSIVSGLRDIFIIYPGAPRAIISRLSKLSPPPPPPGATCCIVIVFDYPIRNTLRVRVRVCARVISHVDAVYDIMIFYYDATLSRPSASCDFTGTPRPE